MPEVVPCRLTETAAEWLTARLAGAEFRGNARPCRRPMSCRAQATERRAQGAELQCVGYRVQGCGVQSDGVRGDRVWGDGVQVTGYRVAGYGVTGAGCRRSRQQLQWPWRAAGTLEVLLPASRGACVRGRCVRAITAAASAAARGPAGGGSCSGCAGWNRAEAAQERLERSRKRAASVPQRPEESGAVVATPRGGAAAAAVATASGGKRNSTVGRTGGSMRCSSEPKHAAAMSHAADCVKPAEACTGACCSGCICSSLLSSCCSSSSCSS
jgi:hypothetical protein